MSTSSKSNPSPPPSSPSPPPPPRESKEAILVRLLWDIPLGSKFTFREMARRVKKESSLPLSTKEFDVILYALQRRGWAITCAMRLFQAPPRVEVLYTLQSRTPDGGEREARK